MEIREYAEIVLFSSRLDEKLIQPKSFVDNNRSVPEQLMNFTRKSIFLRESLSPNSELPKSFPKIHELESANNVSRVLHFFANHELLALELMALSLLKFPAAPPAFRLGIAKEMLEEAQHLNMYRARMNELGMEFGDIPANDYFWRLMSDMKEPKDFCLKMGMTFEQANLDFSLHFLQEFEKIGDHKTGAILKTVYEDEISHVGFGRHWYEKFCMEPGDSLFEKHQQDLVFPLGLQRAKAPGKNFDEVGRRRAGFKSDYIESLKYFSSSRERPPILRYFNPEVEASFIGEGKSYTPSKLIRSLKSSLEHMMWVGSKNQDVIMVEQAPSSVFLDQFIDLKKQYPEYSVGCSSQPEELLNSRRFMAIQPWGTSRRDLALQQQYGSDLLAQNICLDSAYFHSQVSSLEMLKDFLHKHSSEASMDCFVREDEIGRVFSCADEALTYAKELGEFVVKAPFGLSGRGVFFFKDLELVKAYSVIKNILKKQSKVIVEQKFERVFDFSLQRYPLEKGQNPIYRLARFFSGEQGAYAGGIVGRDFLNSLPKDVQRFWTGSGDLSKSPVRALERLQKYLDLCFAEKSYEAAAGIDCFVFRNRDGEYKIKPMVEINARMNMGYFKTKLSPWIHSSRTGFFNIYRRGELAGFSPEKFDSKALKRTRQVKNSLLYSGLLLLSDPLARGDFVAILSVGKDLEDAKQQVNEFFAAEPEGAEPSDLCK